MALLQSSAKLLMSILLASPVVNEAYIHRLAQTRLASKVFNQIGNASAQTLRGTQASYATPESENATSLQHRAEAAFRDLVSLPRAEHQQQTSQKSLGGPLQMQIPEKELKTIVQKLSVNCASQFQNMLLGKSSLHTFGNDGNRSASACSELNGTECQMNANLIVSQVAAGRTVHSNTSLAGPSCLPQHCTSQEDLTTLTAFMRAKAQESLGPDVNIKMSVDCTANGGAIVSATAVSRMNSAWLGLANSVSSSSISFSTGMVILTAASAILHN